MSVIINVNHFNKFKLAMGLISDAEDQLKSPKNYYDINWEAYTTDLKTARRLLSDLIPYTTRLQHIEEQRSILIKQYRNEER